MFKRHCNRSTMPREDGLTLIESLVGLSIGLCLLSALLIFLQYTSREKKQDISLFSVIFAMERMMHSVHMAGFTGCQPLTEKPMPFPHKEIQNQLILWRASAHHAVLQQMASNRLWVNNDILFAAGDQIIVSDCFFSERGEVRRIVSRKKRYQEVELQHPFRRQFSAGAELYQVGEEKYFVAMDHAAGKPALMWQNFRGRSRILAEGISRLHVTYLNTSGVLLRLEGEAGHPVWTVYVVSRNA